MKQANSKNSITKQDIKDIVRAGNEKMEKRWNKDLQTLSKIVATKDDLKNLDKKMDNKLEKLEIKLKDEINNAKTGLASEIVTKYYLDQRLNKLEESIISKTLKEKSKIKDALILVLGILRQGKKPNKEQIEALTFLEQELIS